MSDVEIQFIRALYERRLWTQKELARAFGCSASLVSKIVRAELKGQSVHSLRAV